MSADNWDECPKCGEGTNNEYEPTPLREDYELGFYEGKFFVYYGCQCMSCGFKKQFSHAEKINQGE